MKVLPRRRGRLLNFHRPDNFGIEHELKPESVMCLRNLSRYGRPPAPGRYPRSHSAAVLVALFVGRGGDIYVLLSRRSAGLRSYPGDTSLPGGKLEPIDRSVENAARREAFEEIGLPLDKTKVPLLCILEPFLAGNWTIVTPVVVLITDQTLRPILNEFEVQSIFSHPLVSFLTTSPLREPEPSPRHHFIPPFPEEHEDTDSTAQPKMSAVVSHTPSSLVSSTSPPAPVSLKASPVVSQAHFQPRRSTSSAYLLKPPKRPYHTYVDMQGHGKYVRLHRFVTGREAEGVKPIFGMTASILIRTAQIGFAREPEFELNAPDQPSLPERIATAIREEDVLRRACWEEGIAHDWGLRLSEDEKKDGHLRSEHIRPDKPKTKKPARL